LIPAEVRPEISEQQATFGWPFFMTIPHPMTRDDLQTAAWRHLTQLLEERLEQLRQMNDDPFRDAVQTAGIRGEIKVVKEILALGNLPSASEGAQPDIPVEQFVELHRLGIDPGY
jgi:hypothetical protein